MLYQTTGGLEHAQQLFRHTEQELNSYFQQVPGDVGARFQLAKLYKHQADLSHLLGNISEWNELNGRAVGILEELVASDPQSADFRMLLAGAYCGRPPFLLHGSNLDRVRDGYDRAIDLLEALVAEHPTVPRYRFELSNVYSLVHLWKPGPWRTQRPTSAELQQAEKRLRRALALCRELTQQHPAVPDYSDALALNLGKLARVLEAQGDLAEAENFATRAVARHRALLKRFDNVPHYHDSLASASHSLGRLLCRLNRCAEALPLLEESIAARGVFLKTAPNNRRAQERLADQYHDLAIALAGTGEYERAEKAELFSRLEREFVWQPVDSSRSVPGI